LKNSQRPERSDKVRSTHAPVVVALDICPNFQRQLEQDFPYDAVHHRQQHPPLRAAGNRRHPQPRDELIARVRKVSSSKRLIKARSAPSRVAVAVAASDKKPLCTIHPLAAAPVTTSSQVVSDASMSSSSVVPMDASGTIPNISLLSTPLPSMEAERAELPEQSPEGVPYQSKKNQNHPTTPTESTASYGGRDPDIKAPALISTAPLTGIFRPTPLQVLRSERDPQAQDADILEIEVWKPMITPRLGLFLRQDSSTTTQHTLGAVMIQSVVATGLFGATDLQPGQYLLSINGEPCPRTSAEAFRVLHQSSGSITLKVTTKNPNPIVDNPDESAPMTLRSQASTLPRRRQRTWHG